MTMLEKVARGIHTAMDEGFPRHTRQPWEQLTLQAQQAMLIRARSAIEPLRKPTEEMIEAAYYAVWDGVGLFGVDDAPLRSWEAMIDCVLAEKKGPAA